MRRHQEKDANIDDATSLAGTAEHYIWGDVCHGWRLLSQPDLSVIQERVPPGGAETRHYHTNARQFFFVLSGTATMERKDHQDASGDLVAPCQLGPDRAGRTGCPSPR